MSGTHPDLLQIYCKRLQVVTGGTEVRYEIYPDAAYVFAARLTPAHGTTEIDAVLYTSTDPLIPGDDESKIALCVDIEGRADHFRVDGDVDGGGLFFENGVYVAVNGTTTGAYVYLHVIYLPRIQNCAAFPYPEQGLLACWEEAHPGVPFLENFWNYERENPAEPDDPAGGGGGGDPIGGIPLS